MTKLKWKPRKVGWWDDPVELTKDENPPIITVEMVERHGEYLSGNFTGLWPDGMLFTEENIIETWKLSRRIFTGVFHASVGWNEELYDKRAEGKKSGVFKCSKMAYFCDCKTPKPGCNGMEQLARDMVDVVKKYGFKE